MTPLPPMPSPNPHNNGPNDWLKAWMIFLAYTVCSLGFVVILVFLRWMLAH